MKEVVVIKIKDGAPIDMPEYLSQHYIFISGYYNAILREIKKRKESASSLLSDLFAFKIRKKLLEQALCGKYNIIVIVDLTVPRQSLFDIIARRCGE